MVERGYRELMPDGEFKISRIIGGQVVLSGQIVDRIEYLNACRTFNSNRKAGDALQELSGFLFRYSPSADANP